jgi:hypothetical protein
MEDLKPPRNVLSIVFRLKEIVPDRHRLKNDLNDYISGFMYLAPENLYDSEYWMILHNMIVYHIGNEYPTSGWQKEVIDIYVGNKE